MPDLIGIALRITFIYFYALLLLRLSGKRSVGSLSALDLVVTLIAGDMFDDIIWAEIPLSQGLVGMSTVVLLHSLVAYASWKSQRIEKLVSAGPTRVVRNGRLLPDNLRSQRTPPADVEAGLRLLGEERLEDIREAFWELSGQLSALKTEPARPAQTSDLPALRKAV
jgi:uncharacterized membrane protein YcaP (DUF421 family)